MFVPDPLAEFPPGTVKFRLIKVLQRHLRGLTAREAAPLVGEDHERVTHTFGYLEKAGWVERVAAEKSGKRGRPIIRWTLSAKSRKAMKGEKL